MLALTADIHEVGVNTLLNILTKELIPLEKEGILINGKRIYIAPVSYLGDNLGVNLNLGFTSPTSTYFCRFCYINIQSAHTCCTEKEDILRTEQHYLECIANVDKGDPIFNFGVASKCDLNKLDSFKVYCNYIVDIMHDLLLGVYSYDLVEIIKKAEKEGLFTLDAFNQHKNDMDYGPDEVHYILEDIKDTHLKANKIRAHAREMLTMVRFLPFILKSLKVPEDHEIFLFALIMVDLLDITLQNKISNSDLIKLKDIVTLHNQKYTSLLGSHLRPKFHNIIHYVRIIENSGPLKHIWSMRFEAKHQALKAYAKVCFNRRNLPYSLGKKICYNMAIEFSSEADFLIRIREFKTSGEVFHHFNQQLKKDFKNCARVNYNGHHYAIGDYIISNCSEFVHKIVQIAVDDRTDNVMLVTQKYEIRYESLFRSYKICQPIISPPQCCNIDDFLYPPTRYHPFQKSLYLKKEEF